MDWIKAEMDDNFYKLCLKLYNLTTKLPTNEHIKDEDKFIFYFDEIVSSKIFDPLKVTEDMLIQSIQKKFIKAENFISNHKQLLINSNEVDDYISKFDDTVEDVTIRLDYAAKEGAIVMLQSIYELYSQIYQTKKKDLAKILNPLMNILSFKELKIVVSGNTAMEALVQN